MAQPFDAASRQTTGEPILVAGPIVTNIRQTGAFSVSTTGRLSYIEARPAISQLTWHDRKGTLLTSVGDPGVYSP